jgi:CHAT domain-containing protein
MLHLSISALLAQDNGLRYYEDKYLMCRTTNSLDSCFEVAIKINEILRNEAGDTDYRYLSSLDTLGVIALNLGRRDDALSYFNQSLKIRESLGICCVDQVLHSFNNIASYYAITESFEDALVYFEKCIFLIEENKSLNVRDFGFIVKNYINCLSDLGEKAYYRSDYLNSEKFFLKALDYTVFCSDFQDEYTYLWHALGRLYEKLGSIGKSRYYHNLGISRNQSGESAFENTLGSLVEMGLFHYAQDEFDIAIGYFEDCLNIASNKINDYTFEVAWINKLLGDAYREVNDLNGAYWRYRQSMKVFKQIGDTNSVDFVELLVSFGQLAELNNDDGALIWFREAERLCEQNNLKGDYEYIELLSAILWHHILYTGNSQEVWKYAKKLQLAAELNQGQCSIDNLSAIYMCLITANRRADRVRYMKKYFSVSYAAMNNQIGLDVLSKHELKRSISARFNFILSNSSLFFERSIFSQELLFNHWLLLNGWITNYDALIYQMFQNSSDEQIRNLIMNHKMSIQRRVDIEDSLDRDLVNYEKEINELNEVIRKFEIQISSELKKYRGVSEIVDFDLLSKTVDRDEVYIDIVRFMKFTPSAADSLYYMAFVVSGDDEKLPRMISLGSGYEFDEIVFPYLNGQVTDSTAAIMDGQVYKLLWKPLEEHLAGKTKIYLSPGGIYHSINPETIYHAETGKYLFEEKEIHLVNSGRSFVVQRIYDNRDYTDRTALIMGAPNFDLSYGADSTLLEDNVSFTYQTMRDLSLDGNRRAAPLPATRSEVEGINKTLTSTAWNTQLLTGNDAMESNLKQMDSPRILHIATHGYFLEDIKPENDNGMRMMGMDAQRVAENPMLRSGLLLAGCNKTLADNTQLTGADNGILTAYEAGLLDLSNTELVVLSACETGKGEILNGEGVQGLRKAMTDAGAEHILMSLWKVDDKVTSEYMQTFYGHYAQGKSIRESYNLTRNEIKQKYPQPYYWGAFVLVGE